MALEIWDPKIEPNSHQGVLYSHLGIGPNGQLVKPPDGEGWQITGYRTVRTPRVGKAAEGGTHSERQVPIYGRLKPDTTPAAASSAPSQSQPEEVKLDTTAIAAARAKADEVRNGSLANSPQPAAQGGGAAGTYDAIYGLGQERDRAFGKLLDQLKGNAIETSAEATSALRFGLDRLLPDVKVPKVIDPWEAYDRFKGDITG